jgi:predicted nucleic acid-binding protein
MTPRLEVAARSQHEIDPEKHVSAHTWAASCDGGPTNDIWIAAHAIESGAELLSFDRHFEAIEGLVWTHL